MGLASSLSLEAKQKLDISLLSVLWRQSGLRFGPTVKQFIVPFRLFSPNKIRSWFLPTAILVTMLKKKRPQKLVNFTNFKNTLIYCSKNIKRTLFNQSIASIQLNLRDIDQVSEVAERLLIGFGCFGINLLLDR